MKWLDGYRMRLLLIGFVAAIVLGGGSASAETIMSEATHVDPPVNGTWGVQGCSFSHDGLELYISCLRPGGYGNRDIWVATRETVNDPWAEPVNLGPNVNSSANEAQPAISPDGLEIYFDNWSDLGGLRLSTRPSKDDPWGAPIVLSELGNAWAPDISADGLSLYFASSRSGGYGSDDIWVATRETVNDPWAEPVNLGPNINDGGSQSRVSISADDRVLFFGNTLGAAIAMSIRASKDDEWGPKVLLGPAVNGPSHEASPEISPDGSTLYFDSGRPGGLSGDDNFWQVQFIPIVDFNGDGIVDSADMCIIVDHWGTDEPLCDIGPMPWGDGIVDVQDLIVLAEHLFEDVNAPTLVAHWTLDEAEGDISMDSAGDNDAFVIGGPAWQPTGGMVDGAIQLDGVDDCAITGSIPNPTEGPFSVFVWVKGGAPGQAVLSQMGGARWLCADPSEGNLMTELKGTGRDANELLSQTIITDGNWHRIALVWDGSIRTLYVDDIAVAEDEQTNLEGSDNGLYIGTGKAMEPGSFFSGLIDDIRIYNRALIP